MRPNRASITGYPDTSDFGLDGLPGSKNPMAMTRGTFRSTARPSADVQLAKKPVSRLGGGGMPTATKYNVRPPHMGDYRSMKAPEQLQKNKTQSVFRSDLNNDTGTAPILAESTKMSELSMTMS